MPPTDPTPCPADPYGRQLRNDCTPDPCVVRTGVDSGYESDDYVPGHVSGGDHGSTQSYVVNCTVPTTTPPIAQLPNTGSNPADIALVALLLSGFGVALAYAGRRPEVRS